MVRTLQAELFDPEVTRLGEGPLWDHRESVWRWVDIYGQRVHTADGNGIRRRLELPTPSGCISLIDDGFLAAGMSDGVYELGVDGELTELCRYPDRPGELRSNDGKPDPWGSMVVGTLSLDRKPDHTGLFRFDPRTGGLDELLPHVGITNGLDWDGDSLWYIDSVTYTVRRFAYDPIGPLGEVEAVIDIDREKMGFPDGMAVDVDGCLWVAMYGGYKVIRFTPDGEVDTIVEVPASNVTSCAFGGPGMSQLLITSGSLNAKDLDELPLSGATFIVEPGVAGRQANVLARG